MSGLTVGSPAPAGAARSLNPLPVRLATLAVIGFSLLGVAAAPCLVWGWGFGCVDLGLLLGMYALTGLGITVGFHRLFSHRAFETYPWVQFALAALGSMAFQAWLFQWVAQHRRHHQHSDAPGDLHSPHHHGGGVGGVLRGFWHAHIGWVFLTDPPDLDRYVKDLRRSRALRVANALVAVWAALGLAVPAVLGGVLAGDWAGALTGLVWGGLVRVFLVHQVTWSVNSACHLWGTRPYPCGDRSCNNAVFGVLAFGEGWHNNHHAFPTSARHGLRWWQFDASYLVIRGMAWLGLAWDIKVPSVEEQARGSLVSQTTN